MRIIEAEGILNCGLRIADWIPNHELGFVPDLDLGRGALPALRCRRCVDSTCGHFKRIVAASASEWTNVAQKYSAMSRRSTGRMIRANLGLA